MTDQPLNIDQDSAVDDYWFEQRYQAGLTNEELRQMAINEEEAEKAARKPNLKEISKHFVQHAEKTTAAMTEVTKAAKKATRTFREMGKKLAQVNKIAPGANLQYRPFHTREMQLLREQLAGQR